MEKLRISVTKVNTLFPDDLRSLMGDVLTKPAQAVVGDIIAIVCPVAYSRSVRTHDLSTFLVKTQSGFEYITYERLPVDKQASIAHTSLMISCKYSLGTIIEEGLERMSPGDGETLYADALLMQDQIIIIADEVHDFIENVIEHTGQIDDTVGDRITQVLHNAPVSNHSALALEKEGPALERMLNDFLGLKINDEDGELVPLTLDLSFT